MNRVSKWQIVFKRKTRARKYKQQQKVCKCGTLISRYRLSNLCGVCTEKKLFAESIDNSEK